MKKKCFILFLGITLFLSSCTSLEQKKNLKIAQEFYTVYGEGNDINTLISFYSGNSQWIDMASYSAFEGRDAIKAMYEMSWKNEKYKSDPAFPQYVTINEILSNDTIVAVSGQYNPYYYDGNPIQEMKFSAWLYFDKEGKIKKHVEWRQYSVNDLEDIVNFKKTAEIN